MKKLITLIAAAAMALSLTACGATLTKIEAPPNITLEKGETKLVELVNTFSKENLDAKITPEDATGVKLRYESSDEKVATVDETGQVTAVGTGECVITTT
ncbi:MAG: Ig-like domain-containing protein, partial [Ruthenibacterium sp.]